MRCLNTKAHSAILFIKRLPQEQDKLSSTSLANVVDCRTPSKSDVKTCIESVIRATSCLCNLTSAEFTYPCYIKNCGRKCPRDSSISSSDACRTTSSIVLIRHPTRRNPCSSNSSNGRAPASRSQRGWSCPHPRPATGCAGTRLLMRVVD